MSILLFHVNFGLPLQLVCIFPCCLFFGSLISLLLFSSTHHVGAIGMRIGWGDNLSKRPRGGVMGSGGTAPIIYYTVQRLGVTIYLFVLAGWFKVCIPFPCTFFNDMFRTGLKVCRPPFFATLPVFVCGLHFCGGVPCIVAI